MSRLFVIGESHFWQRGMGFHLSRMHSHSRRLLGVPLGAACLIEAAEDELPSLSEFDGR
jgi:hypothetical protein